MDLITSWSYTTVTEYLQCPKKYQLNRVLKLFPFQETEAMKQGNLIHKHFEDRLKVGKKFPEHLAIYEKFIHDMERKVMNNAWVEVSAEAEVVLDRNLEMIGHFNQQSPRAWFDKNAWYRGKFDIMARVNDRKALILDIKTGKRRNDLDQLELFAAVAFKIFPAMERVTTGYLWTKEKGAIDQKVFFREGRQTPKNNESEKSETDIWAGWLQNLSRINDSIELDKWPCRPSGLCNWCDATPKQCPHSKK